MPRSNARLSDARSHPSTTKELSVRFAPWYYVIDAASFDKLKLGRADLVKTKEAETPEAPEEPVDETPDEPETPEEPAEDTTPEKDAPAPEDAPEKDEPKEEPK